jgi:small-conductance mechanosensitive channel
VDEPGGYDAAKYESAKQRAEQAQRDAQDRIQGLRRRRQEIAERLKQLRTSDPMHPAPSVEAALARAEDAVRHAEEGQARDARAHEALLRGHERAARAHDAAAIADERAGKLGDAQEHRRAAKQDRDDAAD